MEKRYLVKETSVATAENKNFAGEIHVYTFGKGEEMISASGHKRDWENFDRTIYMAKEYGYKRECGAKRSYIYKNPENSKSWKATVEIIEVEV